MSVQGYYREEIFFAGENGELTANNQEKIIEILSGNLAVGIVSGFYEEGFPIYFVSSFALNSLDMTFDEFMEQTNGYFLHAIAAEDRDNFKKNMSSSAQEGFCDYRFLNKNGQGMWMREIHTDSVASDGRPIWICAIRFIDKVYRTLQMSHQAFSMLKDSYFRISSINLKNNFITDLKLMKSEEKEVAGAKGNYREALKLCAINHVEEKDREKFLGVLSPENLWEVFRETQEPVTFSYHRLVEGEWKWVRSEVVPADNYSERHPNVIWYVKNISEEKAKEAEMTDLLQKTNASLRRTLNEEEQYRHAIISDAILVFNINVSKNLIEDDFYEITDENRKSVLAQIGMKAPCSANEFFWQWCSEKVSPADKEAFLSVMNMEYMKQAFERGETEIVLEFETRMSSDVPMILRHTVLLTQDRDTGEIFALNNSKDITEARKRERETHQALLDAYEAANRANDAKTDFLSRMSHDIRTPMNAIIGMTAIAGAHLQEPDCLKNCLSKITSASRHLLLIINEMLDMSKIESGKMALNEGEFNLAELIHSLVTMIYPMAEEKHQELDVHIHDMKHEAVVGDVLRMEQIFVNIVTNAVKYTPDNGRISIDITEKSSGQIKTGCYEMIVEDNGIGMTPEFLERLFEPFERAEDVRISKVQGSGLGMPITKNIIKMMGGDIKVESEIGKGSRVTVNLLLKYTEEDNISLEELIGLPVLVADDDEISCESTSIVLNELGMESEWVLSGKEALQRVCERHKEKEDYFAVILDWRMPEMDGIETARAIRREVGQEIPIVMLSAYDWSEIETEARDAGVNAFISKPLFKSQLTNVFKNFLKDDEKSDNVLQDIVASDYSEKRVLLVEDNDINREIAKEIIEMTGAKVEVAENGQIAVDMFKDSTSGYYNLIFMDIQMPVLNGHEATCAIRALPREDAREISIVAMTANAFSDDIQASKKAGMNEHMAKPIDFNKLKETMARWLK